MNLEKFVYDFGFKVTNVRHHDPYRYVDINSTSAYSYYTKPDIDTTVSLEISQRELERMADYFERSEETMQRNFDEHKIRRNNPAVEEAYNKYRMLLELYR